MKAASLPLAGAARDDARAGRSRSTRREPWPVSMLGLTFDNVSIATAVSRLEAMIAAHQPFRVATTSLELLLRAQPAPARREAVASADLLLCDSRALVCASWCLGNPLPERIRAGAFVEAVMRLCALRGFRVFVVDAKPGAAAVCARHLQRAAPAIQIVGTYSPEAGAPSDPETLRALIAAARPDLLFERLHAHTGGEWLGTRHREFGVPVCVQCSVASDDLESLALPRPTFSITAGGRSRMQRVADAVTQRLRRMAAFTPALLQQWVCMSHLPRPRGRAAIVHASLDWLQVDLGVALTRGACDAHAALWRKVETDRAHCALDVSRIRQIDSTGVAVLARCRLAAQRAGRHFVLVAPTETLRLALVAALLWPDFEVADSIRSARELVPASTRPQPGLVRSLAWCGEVIAANAQDVWQMTSEYVRTFAASGATLIIIDLSRLRSVDTAGAALMLRVKHTGCALRCEVLFTHTPAPVRQSLARAGLDQLLLEGSQ